MDADPKASISEKYTVILLFIRSILDKVTLTDTKCSNHIFTVNEDLVRT